MENNELYHYGILGMKWGVRRFQNKDGTLTAKGKKRYSAEMEKLKKEETVLKNKQRTQAKIDKLMKKRQEIDDMKKQMSGKTGDNKSVKSTTRDVSTKPKSIKDMSDEELASRINRMRLEQTYVSLLPKEKSAGENFVNKYLKPASKKVADKLSDTVLDKVNKTMRDKFGLDADEKAIKALKKEADEWTQKKNIAEAKAAVKKAESGGDSEYDKKKRDADIAKFETLIRNNEKAKSEFATQTVNDISKEVKDAGRDYIQLSLFDDLDK